jgi:hypothetical protein
MAETSTLAEYLRANSYARVPDETRQEEEGWSAYKKGYELRIVVKTQDDLRKVRRLLKEAGIHPGKAFRKSLQWVQPIYGKQAVNSLVALKRKKR